ncbi:MAG: glycoside hydrolase family 32 protein [Eubacteriales bacterium]|nr:glycoside hydrolase family 32 protein [Eubacteriales bacterium]
MEKKQCSPLEEVREMEKNKIAEIPVETRPVYHMSSPVGWMNDPNGFSVFQEDYHLFFQYHPFCNAWGPMHWGHCKSRDFIKWEYLPAAMAPDADYDGGGCYSGSALEADGEHVLIYTGVIDRELEDGSRDYRQVQCMARGNGLDYCKFQGNPVITGDMLPVGGSTEDFRDPKVWKEEDGYYMVVGNRAADGSGQILLYRSDNLETWEFVTVLDQSHGKFGKMWECPDFFALGEKHILMISPQNMQARGYEFHNGNNSAFLYGSYDKSTHQFVREKVAAVDYGLDFYAPQTLQTADGRRIMIGWMQSWDAPVMKHMFAWTGMMTIPRELSFRDGKIYQVPVRELEQYRTDKVEYSNLKIKAATELEGIRGRVIDLLVEIMGSDFQYFQICFAQNEDYEMLLRYDRIGNCLTIDRTHAGLDRDVICQRQIKVRPLVSQEQEETLQLRLLLDKYSAEIFVNNGEQVMSTVFCSPMEADGILFDTDGTAHIHVIKYGINVQIKR